MSHLALLKSPEKFLAPNPEAVDFRNLISSSQSTDTFPVKLSQRPDQYFEVKLHANTHTDGVTEKRCVLQNLLDRGIN